MSVKATGHNRPKHPTTTSSKPAQQTTKNSGKPVTSASTNKASNDDSGFEGASRKDVIKNFLDALNNDEIKDLFDENGKKTGKLGSSWDSIKDDAMKKF